MSRTTPPSPSQQHSRSTSTARSPRASSKPGFALGALQFLHANDKMAALLPTLERMAAIQRDCAAILPGMFNSCEVLQFDADKLVLSTPSAALAAKLKHSLPRLQAGLQKCGWQVNAIRLKVQVGQSLPKITPTKQLALPGEAVNALATLEESLEDTPGNAALRAALRAMVGRHRPVKK